MSRESSSFVTFIQALRLHSSALIALVGMTLRTLFSLCAGVFIWGCSSDQPAGVEARGVYVSHIDSLGYTLVRDGQPFPVRGASGHQDLALLRRYGGNTVRVYEPDSLGAVLDRAAPLGIAVIADLPLPESYKASTTAADEIRRLSPELLEIVEAHHDHPALLYWMLGNEIFNKGYAEEYVTAYNELAAGIRQIDPLHPISSTFNVHQLGYTKIRLNQPTIDFVSFNLFGNLRGLESDLWKMWPIWRGPFILTEWSYNGPWEATNSSWGAPFEPPNATKATHLTDRYHEWVAPLYATERMMGDLAFYWGNKYESTPSWYSFFTPEGHVSEMAFALGNVWSGKEKEFPGPSVEYLLLEGAGEATNHLLPTDSPARASVQFITPPTPQDSFYWEIRPEDWRELGESNTILPGLFQQQSTDGAVFRTPSVPGPYRLYYRIESADGYFSADNIPFYVLNPDDAK